MTANEIKKALYKEKPNAQWQGGIGEGNDILFSSNLLNGTVVKFLVPWSDGKDFSTTIPAQLLIRWMV